MALAEMESNADIFARDVTHRSADIQSRNYEFIHEDIRNRMYVTDGVSAFEDYTFPEVD